MIFSKLRNLVLLAVVFFLGNICCCGASSDEGQWYTYNSKIELSGVIVKKVVYGPPDYGEPPKEDQKITIYILRLEKPINVKGDKENPNSTDQDDFTGVGEIELQTLKAKISFKKFLNRKVILKGHLYEASAGAEFTDVLMDVSAVKLKK